MPFGLTKFSGRDHADLTEPLPPLLKAECIVRVKDRSVVLGFGTRVDWEKQPSVARVFPK